MLTAQSVRERLYIMVFQTDTVAGRRFDKILLLIILASLFGFNAARAALAFSRQGEKPWVTLLAIALALLLQPLFKLLPVAGLTALFVAACWLMHIGTHITCMNQRRMSST